jgi:hypothetical protein
MPNLSLDDQIDAVSDPIVLLNDLRAKVLAGEEVTSNEYALALHSIRRARTAAPSTTARGKRAPAPSTAINPESDFA